MRSDSSLITGLSSASSRRVAEQQRKAAEAKISKGAQLRPHGEIIKAEIAKIRDEITDEARDAIRLDMSAKEVQTIIGAARLADQKIVSLQNRLLKAVRAEVEA